MPVISKGELVEDIWAAIGEGDDIPADGAVVVSLPRWKEDGAALAGRNAPLGIFLTSAEPPSEIADSLDRFQMIALEFPAYTDGRAYSYARQLRDKYGYEGELRAVGNVLRDQLQLMHRCGFDSYKIERDDAIDAWQKAMAEIDVFYQPAEDDEQTVLSLRQEDKKP